MMTDDKGTEPKPARLPQPTYWPAIMALALCFGLLGVLTSVWLVAAGGAGTLVAVAGWIGDLRHEPDE